MWRINMAEMVHTAHKYDRCTRRINMAEMKWCMWRIKMAEMVHAALAPEIPSIPGPHHFGVRASKWSSSSSMVLPKLGGAHLIQERL